MGTSDMLSRNGHTIALTCMNPCVAHQQWPLQRSYQEVLMQSVLNDELAWEAQLAGVDLFVPV